MTSRRTLLRTMVLATGAIVTSSIIPLETVAATSLAQRPPVVLPSDDESTAVWACWIGHSTVLLRIGGMWILTDPVLFGSYGVSILGVTLGPMRITEPALTFDEVPRPDLILLSHAHMDHMDRTTLRRISERWPAQIDVITATNTRDIIEDLPWKSLNELDWCESTQIGAIHLTALQVRHNGWRLPGEPCSGRLHEDRSELQRISHRIQRHSHRVWRRHSLHNCLPIDRPQAGSGHHAYWSVRPVS